MILGPGQELRLVLAAANDTADSTWVASWFRNAPASSPVNAPQPMEKGTTNGTTPVTVIAAPSSGQTAHLTEFSLVNTDTAPITVELQLYESSTPYTFSTWTLSVGDVLKCDKNNRWYLTDSSGREKVAGVKGDPGSGEAVYSAENKDAGTITRGMACAVHSSGTGVVKASAADATKPAVGLAQTTTATTIAVPVQTSGLFVLSNWTAVTGATTLSAHALYFLDPSTPGMLTTTRPTSSGQVVQPVGVAVGSETLDLFFDEPYLLS